MDRPLAIWASYSFISDWRVVILWLKLLSMPFEGSCIPLFGAIWLEVMTWHRMSESSFFCELKLLFGVKWLAVLSEYLKRGPSRENNSIKRPMKVGMVIKCIWRINGYLVSFVVPIHKFYSYFLPLAMTTPWLMKGFASLISLTLVQVGHHLM